MPADRDLAMDNLQALFAAMSTLPGGVIDRRPGLCRHHAFPGNPMFKGVWAVDLPDEALPEAVAETEAWFRALGAPFAFWWTGPRTRPAGLGAVLQQAGMASMEQQQAILAPGIVQAATGAPVMAMDLDKTDPELLQRVPAGYRQDEATDAAGLAEFASVFMTTYGIPAWAGQAWIDATLAFPAGQAPWRIHVGRLNGRAVATSITFADAGVGSPYGVAVLPEAQGQGLGAAITLGPLLEAAARTGIRRAALFSTEQGYAVYQRIGFRDTGARIDRYLWRAG